MIKYIDIHNHNPNYEDENKDVISIINFIESFDYKKNNYYSIGLHPWFLNELNFVDNLNNLYKFIKNKNFIAVGECGLDKKCKTDFEFQSIAFAKQIFISEDLKKPLIIHCFKAYNEIIEIRKKTKSSQTWIIHGFNENLEIAQKLISLNIYVSFGEIIFNEKSKALKTLKSIDLNYVFFETDESIKSIYEIYEKASEILNIEIEKLKQIVANNFSRTFTNL